ncbi:MAG: hypothetical protein M3116_06115 [Actinomycetota bacterium]|nr:hypothetical protein [Actinomycetota bacterium]
MKTSYRHVVVGAGVIGTAAALRIAERNDGDVLVLEQYRLGHTGDPRTTTPGPSGTPTTAPHTRR